MAIFGTPTVIGTLSTSATGSPASGTGVFQVPITATTAQGDCIVVIVGCAGSGANNIPVSISDSQNLQNYGQGPTISGSGQITSFRIYNSAVLTNTDSVTVTFPTTTNAFLKNIIILDCPGAVADDVSATATNSGTSTSPSVSTNLSFTNELVIFAQNNGNAGGAPSVSPPLNNLAILHSGTAVYTSVSYQIVTSGGPYTASDSISSSGWGVLTVGMVNSIPLFVNQNPYSPGGYYPSLVFNPSLSWSKPRSQPPVLPLITPSAPVNITGAQANVFTPGVNFLKGDASSFNASTGNWTNGGNTTIVQTNSVSHNAQGALQVTATGSGTVTILSATAGKIQQNGLPAANGDVIFAAGWVLASTIGRNAQIGFSMLDANGTVLGSTIFGTATTDSTGVWTLITATGTVNQAATAYVRANIQWTSAGASEVHYLSDAFLYDITSGSGLNEQIQIFTPNQPSFQLQPDGIPYPLSIIGSLQYLPRQMQTVPFTVFQPGVVAANTVVAPVGIPQVFQTFAPQFPWQQIMPGIQFIPSLNWVKQQISTSNPVTYIDGGAAGSIIANAQFSDIAVSISVSATANVSVSSPAPPTIITGIVSSVSVSAAGGSISEKITGVISSVTSQAIAGSVSITISGTVANVSAQGRSGIISLGPAIDTANVSVTTPSGNEVVIKMGSVSNVVAASTGTASVSQAGVPASAIASAVAGVVTDKMIGIAANVSVASSGIASIQVAGNVVNVNTFATAGSIGTFKSVTGVPAEVLVISPGGSSVSFSAPAVNTSVIAVAGSVKITVAGKTNNISVAAGQPDFAGNISISGSIVDPDINAEQLLSRQGKLLSIPVENILVSKTTPPQPQGI